MTKYIIASHIEIIANSSYAPRNNGNYSQVSNMIITRGICDTTQSGSITSPQNNDKIPSTIMHTTLKQYLGLNLPQTMRGLTSNLQIEMVLMMEMVKIVM